MLKRVLIRYEWLALLGLVIAVFAFLKVFGVLEFSSDVFWAIAGLEILGVALIELFFENKEDQVAFDLTQEDHSNSRYKILAERMNDDPAGAVVTLTHGNVGVTMTYHTFRESMFKLYKED